MSLQESPPRAEELSIAFECPVCSVPVEAADTCCSVDCAVAAEREVERNVTLLKSPHGRQMEPESRQQLTQRNGRLAAALLSWRPESQDG